MSDGTSKRLASLDQFRGYTVAGMFLVNFVGSFEAIRISLPILKHHTTYCSYADTIMPQFFFAVGFAFRLTFGRRMQSEGAGKAYWHAVKRFLGLALLAITLYSTPKVAENWAGWQKLVETEGWWGLFHDAVKHSWFQTLLHIAVTSLWLLPVIRAGWQVRVIYGLISAVSHIVLSAWFYFDWAHVDPGTIDGGPLGFLTWSIPTLAGTLACDAFVGREKPLLGRVMLWGIILMGLGWGMSCLTRLYDIPAARTAVLTAERETIKGLTESLGKEPDPEKKKGIEGEIKSRNELLEKNRYAEDAVFPRWERWEGKTLTTMLCEAPFVAPPDEFHRQRNYWQMSQMDGTVSYLTFSAGFSLVLYGVFYVLADVWGLQLGLFRTLGTNALFGYVIHGIVDTGVRPFFPNDCPMWGVWVAFGIYFLLCYLFIRALEKQKIYIRL